MTVVVSFAVAFYEIYLSIKLKNPHLKLVVTQYNSINVLTLTTIILSGFIVFFLHNSKSYSMQLLCE